MPPSKPTFAPSHNPTAKSTAAPTAPVPLHISSKSEFNTPTKFSSIGSGVVFVGAGNYYVETKKTFSRPADVTVKVRQMDGSQECGVVSVFPQAKARHSGYNAGVGWWGAYFGAGVDGSISKYGKTNGATSKWHTLRINVAADGKVYYYLDSQLRWSVSDNKYQTGVIRLGYNCRRWC